MGNLYSEEWVGLDAILGAGVYALIFYGDIVYIGKAKRVLHRVYAHKNLYERTRRERKLPPSGPFHGIKPIRFNQVSVIPCKEVDLDRIERQMIAKHRPKHNTNLVPVGQSSLAEVGFDFSKLLNVTTATPVELVRRF